MIRSSPGLNYFTLGTDLTYRLTDRTCGEITATHTQAIVVARGMGRCEGDEG